MLGYVTGAVRFLVLHCSPEALSELLAYLTVKVQAPTTVLVASGAGQCQKGMEPINHDVSTSLVRVTFLQEVELCRQEPEEYHTLPSSKRYESGPCEVMILNGGENFLKNWSTIVCFGNHKFVRGKCYPYFEIFGSKHHGRVLRPRSMCINRRQ